MKTKNLLAFVAASIAVAATGGLVAPTPASAHWSCGRTPPPDIDDGGGHFIKGSSVRMLNGSSTKCTTIGWTYAGESLDYHCWALGEDRKTWTYAINDKYKDRGWIRDELLADNGALTPCPGEG
ncbi:hypothetical protein [Micromonospora sp. WMMD714]|uniref:hypothetical protein n=1 Tax=Micromonospora sp. WMMD714 TaxID=3016097 RepID=UPI00249B5828|nr:hypothetical protein [Micromonospora sp. WMMD714]WFE63551.1 hypothetical protein O7625_09765 [Micromonospora sp. WMMD714]